MAKTRKPKEYRVGDICNAMETLAPLIQAEEWDNVGLLIGDRADYASKLLLAIDLTPAVLAEARQARAEMVMAYHPIVFKPVSRLTAQATPVAYAAARAGLAVYSPHTALDAATGGTNDVLAEAIGIRDAKPLQPASSPEQCKVVVFTPASDLQAVSQAAFACGAGVIGNYTQCTFYSPGEGTFRGQKGTHPTLGKAGRLEHAQELRLEFLAPAERLDEILSAIRQAHSYETPGIDVYPTQPLPGDCGLGRVGPLAKATTLESLIRQVKKALGVGGVMVVGDLSAKVRRAACCAGSCGKLIYSALTERADVYVTGELRHHDALEARRQGLAVVCVGHSHSERIVLSPLRARLGDMLPGLAIQQALHDRDPFEMV